MNMSSHGHRMSALLWSMYLARALVDSLLPALLLGCLMVLFVFRPPAIYEHPWGVCVIAAHSFLALWLWYLSRSYSR